MAKLEGMSAVGQRRESLGESAVVSVEVRGKLP
jgi:hypothetical protein